MCLLRSNPAYSQLSPAYSTKLNQVFDSLCIKYALQGVSACIIVPDIGIWTGVYGASCAGVPIRKDMLMGIGSNTKTFIAALMLKLQEMHKLSLDDTIGRWIVNSRNIDGHIKIRQLLNHTSGIFNFTDHPHFMDSLNAYPTKIWKKEELLNLVKRPNFQCGKGWAYSNTNYILAGIIIEKVMNKPIERVLQELIFMPIGLVNTYYYPQQLPSGEIAHQWTKNIKSSTIDLATINWCNNALFSMASSSGAIMQTAEDNAKFWHNLFSGQIINQNSMKAMMDFVDADDNASYGLGIYRYSKKSAINNRTSYSHGGSNFSFTNANLVDSTSKVCYSVLTNQDIVDEDDLLINLIGNLQRVINEIIMP